MNVIVPGEKKVFLTQDTFLAEGGEGKVYVSGQTAYKIYHDPTRVMASGKMVELAAINDPDVIRPLKDVFNERQQRIGYTMRYVPSTRPLCSLFPKAFRDREGLGHDKIRNLVLKFRDRVQHVHDAGILIVDLNEMNFLVDKQFQNLYAIDTDSYQTRGFPATAIMPSVADPLVIGNKFTEGSDWFSFACTSFQLFTGIHPFKGVHPSIKGFEDRMKAGITVFDPSVKTPPAMYPVNVIPPVYLDWYRSVFVDRHRTAPPTDYQGRLSLPTAVAYTVVSSDSLTVRDVASFDGRYVVSYRDGWALDNKGSILFGRDVLTPSFEPAGFGYMSDMTPIVVGMRDGFVYVFDLKSRQEHRTELQGQALFVTDANVYLKNGNRLSVLDFRPVGGKVLGTLQFAVSIMERATRRFNNCLYQNMLGSAFFNVFPSSGGTYQIRTPEIDRKQILDAKYQNGLLGVSVHANGDVVRYLYRVVGDKATVVEAKTVSLQMVNFVVMANGITVLSDDEGTIEVFSIDHPVKRKTVPYDGADGRMTLCLLNGKVGGIAEDYVVSLTMK